MRRALFLATILTFLALAAATAAAQGHGSVFVAHLSGDAEIPAVSTDGSGFASLSLSADGESIDFRLYASDVPSTTMAHLHLGAVDQNGPVVAWLFGPADPAVDPDGLLAEGTLTAADLVSAGEFDGSMGHLLELIHDGDIYVNLHTDNHPAGEIRGQLGPAAVNFTAPLSGGAEIPPVASTGTGVASFSVDEAETAVTFTVITYGLEGITQAHIHLGDTDENGPVVAFLFGLEPAGVTGDGILARGSIGAADIIAVPGFDGSMGQLLDHLRAGTAYVNVHTVAYPPGEIRGQVMGLAIAADGAGTFTDDDDSVHEANIETMAAAGITRGCNPPVNDLFCPQDTFTRGQGAAFLYRAFNLTPAQAAGFVDIGDSVFATEIDSLAALGITRGCNPPANDRFCPGDPITRAQWASLVVRALGLSEGAGDDLFTDDDDSVHESDIDRFATAGITRGCNPPVNDLFCPDDIVTREQAASFTARMLGWREVTRDASHDH